MKIKKLLLLGFMLNGIICCKAQNAQQNQVIISDTTLVDIKDYSSNFILDMKYATEDNFLKRKVYDCQSCFLRLKTINSLIRANKEFIKKGYRIKLLDCYRPLDIQKKMWQIIPNANYVANPASGSIHNRGGAVDITLVDEKGVGLNMGTVFDFFGIESSHNYSNFSVKILKNRQLLKKIMTKNNFESLDSEWWHYNLIDSRKDNLSNFKWKCE